MEMAAKQIRQRSENKQKTTEAKIKIRKTNKATHPSNHPFYLHTFMDEADGIEMVDDIHWLRRSQFCTSVSLST